MENPEAELADRLRRIGHPQRSCWGTRSTTSYSQTYRRWIRPKEAEGLP